MSVELAALPSGAVLKRIVGMSIDGNVAPPAPIGWSKVKLVRCVGNDPITARALYKPKAGEA